VIKIIKIAVSLDGVVFPTCEILNEMFFRQFGEDIDWYKFDFDRDQYLSTKGGVWIKDKLNDRRFYQILDSRPDVKEVIHNLMNKRNFKVIYFTVRSSLFHKDTVISLQRNHIPCGNGMINYFNERRAPRTKLKIIAKQKVDVVIENNANIIENAERSKACRVILFNTCRNGGCKFGERVNTWKEVESMLLDYHVKRH